MSLPELQQNPLVQRVIDIFDTDGNGEVDFRGLIPNGVLNFFNNFKYRVHPRDIAVQCKRRQEH